MSGRKKQKSDSLKTTVESKVVGTQELSFLKAFNNLFNTLLRMLFVDLVIRGGSLNKVKTFYIFKFGISARHFNSMRMLVMMKWNARKSAYQRYIDLLDSKIKKLESFLKDANKKLKKLNDDIKSIQAFKRDMAVWKKYGTGRKPKLSLRLRSTSLDVLIAEMKEIKNQKHLKSQRLAALIRKKQKAEKMLETKSMCFGGRRLFKAQHSLEKAGYASHEEWKAHWELKRHDQSYWLGSKDESHGNQNAQFDLETQKLKLRVPKSLEDQFGEHVYVELDFNEEDLKKIEEALKSGISISYRLIERIKTSRTGRFSQIMDSLGNFCGYNTQFYFQASFDLPMVEKQTSSVKGVIGLDLNADHIALVETNASGNPISQQDFLYSLKGLSSDQRKAVMGDVIADVCDHALKVGKSVVIEDLDFQKKKKSLREERRGKRYNAMLSEFMYSQFSEMIAARCYKAGIKLINKKANFTSIIGAYKFRGYRKLSFHQTAALTLARRGQGLCEGAKVYRSGSPDRMNGLDLGNAPEFLATRNKGHIWSFWLPHTRKIRAAMHSSTEKTSKELSFHVNPRRPSGLYGCLRYLEEEKGEVWSEHLCSELDDWVQACALNQ